MNNQQLAVLIYNYMRQIKHYGKTKDYESLEILAEQMQKDAILLMSSTTIINTNNEK